MKFNHINNFSTILAAPASEVSTVLDLVSDTSAMSDATETNVYSLTLTGDQSADIEIVYVTNRNTDGTLDVIRGREGTLSPTGGWPVGAEIENRLTQAAMEQVASDIENAQSTAAAAQSAASNLAPTRHYIGQFDASYRYSKVSHVPQAGEWYVIQKVLLLSRSLDTASLIPQVPSVADTPPGADSVAFTPDSSKLVVTHESPPYLSIYNTADWTVDTGTPTLGNTSSRVAVNNGYMAVYLSFQLTVYSLSTYNSVPVDIQPSDNVKSLEMVGESWLLVGTSSGIEIYQVGPTFTKYTGNTTLPVFDYVSALKSFTLGSMDYLGVGDRASGFRLFDISSMDSWSEKTLPIDISALDPSEPREVSFGLVNAGEAVLGVVFRTNNFILVLSTNDYGFNWTLKANLDDYNSAYAIGIPPLQAANFIIVSSTNQTAQTDFLLTDARDVVSSDYTVRPTWRYAKFAFSPDGAYLAMGSDISGNTRSLTVHTVNNWVPPVVRGGYDHPANGDLFSPRQLDNPGDMALTYVDIPHSGVNFTREDAEVSTDAFNWSDIPVQTSSVPHIIDVYYDMIVYKE